MEEEGGGGAGQGEALRKIIMAATIGTSHDRRWNKTITIIFIIILIVIVQTNTIMTIT